MATTPTLDIASSAAAQQHVSKIYGVDDWGAGYFYINSAGHLAVAPSGNRRAAIDVYDVVTELERRQTDLPVLLRFPQILDDRVAKIHEAFRSAAREFDYGGGHTAVFPIKVNQKADVVRRLLRAGHRYDYGLEVGSKAELLAALSLPLAKGAIIVCNGLKDEALLRMAIYSELIGKRAIVVVEDRDDMIEALEVGERLRIQAQVGIRVKLYSRGSGKWEDSGGEFAKFGMGAVELVATLEELKRRNAGGQLQMLHFHIGSQITDIRRGKLAVKEAARVYAKVRKMGYPVEYLNVGGGLGVDYDGSATASEFSANYSVQEFANDVIYTIGEVCDSEQVPEPVIVTESGRAVTAHHSMLVTGVDKAGAPGEGGEYDVETIRSESEPVRELIDMARGINAKNFREYYHDALQQRDDLLSLFDLGYLDLEDKAKGEWLFWELCRRVLKLSQSAKPPHEEFQELANRLAAKYVCNFSVFQSMPDSWAFSQLFPVVPIHRLDEVPSAQGVLCDVTCDSDGTVDRFVDVKDVKETLELHELREGEPYYLAILLLGAYQETLGDMHNLFGEANEVSVAVGEDGRVLIEKTQRGDRVRDVLGYVDFDAGELRESIARQLSQHRSLGLLSDEQEHEVLATLSRTLDDYTYLV